MQSLILYTPEQIVLDLFQPDLGHPDAMEILQRHYRQSGQPRRKFSKANPAFVCLAHEDSGNPGLYLKKYNDEWFAAHYEAGKCTSKRLPALMSDEHKRQQDYWARAAQTAGYAVDLEHKLPTGTRPDVFIDGPVKTGIEVQRSPMTKDGAINRSEKAQRSGVLDVWFTSNSKLPRWAFKVPSVLPVDLGIDRPREDHTWDELPPPRSVTAAGLRVVRAVRCQLGNFQRCPYGRNWCGKFHPKIEPWGGLTVDDVAAQVPAGIIVPLRSDAFTRRVRRRSDVFLVSPDSRDLYRELTHLKGDWEPRPPSPRPPRVRSPRECVSPQPAAPLAPMFPVAPPALRITPGKCHVPGCGESARLYPAGWLCDGHRPGTPPPTPLRNSFQLMPSFRQRGSPE